MEKEDSFNEHELRLRVLIIIEKNVSIDDLYNSGYKYFQITKFLKNEISSKNAELKDGKLVITDKGIEEKIKLIKQLDINKNEKIVLPQMSSKSNDLLNITDVFIPSENELPF